MPVMADRDCFQYHTTPSFNRTYYANATEDGEYEMMESLSDMQCEYQQAQEAYCAADTSNRPPAPTPGSAAARRRTAGPGDRCAAGQRSQDRLAAAVRMAAEHAGQPRLDPIAGRGLTRVGHRFRHVSRDSLFHGFAQRGYLIQQAGEVIAPDVQYFGLPRRRHRRWDDSV